MMWAVKGMIDAALNARHAGGADNAGRELCRASELRNQRFYHRGHRDLAPAT
jgi:hypothetical protein